MESHEGYADSLALRIMERLADAGASADCVHDILDLIRSATGLEAVGIRLRDGDDFPYYVSRGFSDDFVLAESRLCAYDPATGKTILGADGSPDLACMCGNVICGRTDPAQPFFTAGGSFWSNGTTRLLATTTDADRRAHTRNRCNSEGYESVALIPLRSGGERIGLLQLNDRRPGRFSPGMIEYFERLGACVGIALMRKRADESARRLDESRLLLREVQHRVKNDLAAAVGLLGLQAAGMAEGAARAATEQARRRLECLAALYEKYFRAGETNRLPVAEYLRGVVAELAGDFPDRVAVEVDIEEIGADPALALPLGIIANELLTNSLSHGFGGADGGGAAPGAARVSVSLRAAGKAAEFAVADNGAGYVPGEGEGFGAKLVRGLAGQIDGTVRIETSPGQGTRTKVSFPLAAG